MSEKTQKDNPEIYKENRRDGIPSPQHRTYHRFRRNRNNKRREELLKRITIEGIEIKNLGENRATRQVGFEIDDC